MFEVRKTGFLGEIPNRVSNDRDFADVVVETGDSAPPVLPGETVTFDFSAGPPFNFVSWDSMLICTNHGFTGVDGQKLPNQVGKSVSVYTQEGDSPRRTSSRLPA